MILIINFAGQSANFQVGFLADDNYIKVAVVDHDLPDEVERVLKKIAKTYVDIKKIVLVRGVGGFVATRVAVSFANALAFALNLQIAVIDLIDLGVLTKRHLALVSIARGEVLVFDYEHYHLPQGSNKTRTAKIPIKNWEIMDITTLKTLITGKKVVGDLSDLHQKLLQNIKLDIVAFPTIKADNIERVFMLATWVDSTEPLYAHDPNIGKIK